LKENIHSFQSVIPRRFKVCIFHDIFSIFTTRAQSIISNSYIHFVLYMPPRNRLISEKMYGIACYIQLKRLRKAMPGIMNRYGPKDDIRKIGSAGNRDSETLAERKGAGAYAAIPIGRLRWLAGMDDIEGLKYPDDLRGRTRLATK
jgi:hypothetical protein